MITTTLFGLILGVGVAALLTLLFGVYTIGPTERGVLTTFGRAQRTNGTTDTDPTLGALLTNEENPGTAIPTSASSSPAALTSSGRGNVSTKWI